MNAKKQLYIDTVAIALQQICKIALKIEIDIKLVDDSINDLQAICQYINLRTVLTLLSGDTLTRCSSLLLSGVYSSVSVYPCLLFSLEPDSQRFMYSRSISCVLESTIDHLFTDLRL